ncbi:MAG TPA: ribonuclease Y [Armatimonadota bacterium]|nr:ribonuclease Y [Armatimonadota bacterium]
MIPYTAGPVCVNYTRRRDRSIFGVITVVIIGIASAFVGGGIASYFLMRNLKSVEGAFHEAERQRDLATKDLENERQQSQLKVAEEVLRIRGEIEQEQKEARAEISRLERRVTQKDETLDRKLESVERRERDMTQKERSVEERLQKSEELLTQRQEALQRVSGLTLEQARAQVLETVRDQVQLEAARMARTIEEEAVEHAEAEARRIVTMSVQRVSVEQTMESTVSVVPISSDEIKGRIIGREGRNIRTFETLTGVDLIIDDTPEAVVISGFDPVRREVARQALQSLIEDGRIHPARIEEAVERAKAEVERQIKLAGERAVMATGLTGLHPELVRALGRLRYRTSFGQNVLDHSIEVCHLARMMAEELGANIEVAKRAGLLHDIGKAAESESEGAHHQLSAELAKRCREKNEVLHAIAAHHGEPHPETVEAVLVQSADAISAARPGARRESLQNYIKRLEKLEEIAVSQPGVERCFAIQAGREIRIMVKPEQVDDQKAYLIAKDVAREIEEHMQYPGQIKVTVIRETRQVEYAK